MMPIENLKKAKVGHGQMRVKLRKRQKFLFILLVLEVYVRERLVYCPPTRGESIETTSLPTTNLRSLSDSREFGLRNLKVRGVDVDLIFESSGVKGSVSVLKRSMDCV